MNITFEKATSEHKQLIFTWLDAPHVKKYWDNSQEHRDDIINFVEGRKSSSNYFDGVMHYWVGYIDKQPFCFVLSSEYKPDESLPKLHQENLSQTGKTIGIDFCIGNTDYLGKGLASITLQAFADFLKSTIDIEIDTLFIDPDKNNPRAIHVYEKAGFEFVDEFTVDSGFFDGHRSLLMIKKI